MPCIKPSLLVVDDQPSIRASISHLLIEIGFAVRSARDGFSALRELREEIPNILLSDLNMPGMSGYELLRVVRQRFPSIQVIAMSGAFSGYQVPHDVVADAFYQKGGGMDGLIPIIGALQFIERRDPLPARVAEPLLIQGSGLDTSRDALVTITCPECLRASHQPVYDSCSRELITNCNHCGTSIRYSFIESPYDLSPRGFSREAGAEISAQFATCTGN
jgi:CheY-like chemotaxis protein